MDIKKKTAAAPAEPSQYVTFSVGGEEYGLSIQSIAEVVRPLKVTPLPRMPEFVEGVINVRGSIIPVVDLRRRFAVGPALAADARKARMMITKGAFPDGRGRGRGLLALLVDGVSEVIHLSPDQVEPAPEAARGRNADFIAGMGKVRDRLIILVDLGKVLTQQERAALSQSGGAGDAGRGAGDDGK